MVELGGAMRVSSLVELGKKASKDLGMIKEV
jgi:hypothetical protein